MPPSALKCGKPYSYVKRRRRGGRTYLYAVHYLGYEKRGGRVVKRVRECYLGPERVVEYEEALELINGLYARARAALERGGTEPLHEFLFWLERRLSPLISRLHREARRALEGNSFI